jgi:hypothetical protein
VVDHFGKAYVAGNVVEGNERVTKDNWDGGVQPDAKGSLEAALANIRTNVAYPHAPVTIQTAQKAYDYVLANAGATLPRRDPVDERIIQNVRTGKATAKADPNIAAQLANPAYNEHVISEIAARVNEGIITDPSQVGGYPEYKGTPYKDSDGDGMPDEWELKYGLNPHDPSDAAGDLNGDGYSNIEKFIYGLDPKAAKVNWADPKNNVDARNTVVK